jgi:hypothetical protein
MQLMAQLPQCEVVVSGVSQPLFASPSQLPKPAAQTGVQTPATQEVVPFWLAHATPHAPQLVALVWVSVSQPFAGLPSQSPAPALHCGEQTPEAQAVVPAGLVQVLPQVPQLEVVLNDVSHPVATLPSQSPNPVLHAIAQEPATHDGVPLVLLQDAAQAPQWLSLVFVFTSQPLLAIPSQSPKPLLHEAMAQDPVAQLAVALARLQGLAQAPQSASVVSCCSQPSEATALQLPQPTSQVPTWHAPPKQVEVAWGELQTVPHAPQC